MKFGSLFAGIGGGDLGLELAGWRCLWQCEIDPFRRRVLAAHWPDVERFEDVQRLVGAGGVDLIIGGFPCQDLSVAGRRAGLHAARSGLFFEFARVLGEVRPEWCIIENVPGLLSSSGGRDFAVVLTELGQLGYGLAWRILDSRYFGVPQRRRRVYIVGCLGGAGRAGAVLFEREGGGGDTAAGRTAGEGVAATLGASTYDTGWKGADHETYVPEVSPTEVAATLEASDGHHGYSSPRADGADNLIAGGEVQTVRRLTPVECERLQGFPDGWTDMVKDGPRYAALGDAMTVNVVYWIGSRIRMLS